MLLVVNQEEEKATIPILDIDNPTFYWIFRNIDFVRWTDRSDHQVLWLSGPSKCNIQQVSSHVVEHKKARAKTRYPVLYFFCSTAAEERSIVNTFVHTLLTQIISCSLEDKKLLIARSFLQTLVKWFFEPMRAKDESLYFYQKLSRSVKDPPAMVREILAASPNALWFALQAALTHEQEDMLIVVEGLDKIKHRKGEFIKGVHELVVHLKERISGFKSLLTSGSQGEIKETLNGLTHIEYDKERKG
jgi:ankyrin repeat domain-containing protein 50